MYSRVQETLEATGLSTLLANFKEYKMTDSNTTVCISFPALRKTLDKVIPLKEDQDRFVCAFKKQEPPSTCTARTEDEPSVSPSCEKKHANESTEEATSKETNTISTTSQLSKVSQDKSSTENIKTGKSFRIPTDPFKNTGEETIIRQLIAEAKNHELKKVETNAVEDTATQTKVAEANLEPNTHLSVLRLPHKPAQIIDIAPAGSSNTGRDRLIFQEVALKEILSQVGRKPVALLSIAGPSRQGKSFILGYMLKYLQSVSISTQNSTVDSDWMGKSESKRHSPLSEGFSWRYGTERETVGIWMWPQPFTLKAADGFEFDVLLVDTQGVFDAHTDTKDWATIVGLSLLTSSCLIFNIMHSLQEDSLITLKDFMDFGLMATQTGDQNTGMGSSEDGKSNPCGLYAIPPKEAKPFQKLTFLIRDWPFSDAHSFGVSGGAEYLQWKLDQKNTEAGGERRHQIKQCFDQLDCFLMPDPGENVKRITFDGSVAEMDSKFADNIQIFIEHLFDPSTFSPKYISGNLVTGDDLYTHFEQYVRIFNSDQMPSPQDLNGATAIICNRTVVNKCLQNYETSLRDMLVKMKRNFALEDELQRLHEIALEWALVAFQKSRKMGTREEIVKFHEELMQRIDASFKGTKIENLKKRNETLQGATENLHQYFNNLMETDIREAYQDHGADNFVIPDMFERIAENCLSRTQSKFEEALSLESFELLNTDEKRRFETAIASWVVSQRLLNQNNITDAEKHLSDTVAKTTSDYKSHMKEAIQKSRYWSEEHLKGTDTSIWEEILQKFELKYSKSFLFQQGKQQLIENIEKRFENIQEKVKLQNQIFLLELKQFVVDLVKMYMDIMEEAAESRKSLADTHAKAKENCTRSLEKSDSFNKIPPNLSQEYLSDLSVNISSTYFQLISKWLPRKRQELIKQYKDRMSRFFDSSKQVFTFEELQEQHTLNKVTVTRELKTFLWKIPLFDAAKATAHLTWNSKSIFENFDEEIDAFMESIVEKNKFRKIALQKDIQGYLFSAIHLFFKLNKEINDYCYAESQHDQLLTKAKDTARTFFHGEVAKNLGPIPLQEYEEELDNYFNEDPIFKKSSDGHSLIISGPGLKFSRELCTLENMKADSIDSVREIHWISSGEVVLDENLCGEFWAGKNLVIYSKKVQVIGNDRIIDVSGGKGRAANNNNLAPPPTPREFGQNGRNGENGEAGESGGNVAIVTEFMENAQSLRITSNGGAGGNGQCGGYGSNGKNGIDGDQRCKMTLEELEKSFPSPAKFRDKICTTNLAIGELSLKELAVSEDAMEELPALNDSSKCWLVKTKAGAIIRYAFYQDHLNGYTGGRSFYVWLQGAPGTSGQPGGIGGFGGWGGNPGNPGDITINPTKFEHEIEIQRNIGIAGITGRRGMDGMNGSNGNQGTDFAIIDPYAGIWNPKANKYPLFKISGNLRMYIKGVGLLKIENSAETLTSGTLPADHEEYKGIVFENSAAAYCPHFEEYISFFQTSVPRETLKVFKRALLKDERGAAKASEFKRRINIQEIVAKHGVI